MEERACRREISVVRNRTPLLCVEFRVSRSKGLGMNGETAGFRVSRELRLQPSSTAPTHSLFVSTLVLASVHHALFAEIGILLPNNQRQHRTLHIQKDVLPYTPPTGGVFL